MYTNFCKPTLWVLFVDASSIKYGSAIAKISAQLKQDLSSSKYI